MKAFTLDGYHINWVTKVKFIDDIKGKSFMSASADRSLKVFEYDP